ncbi:SPW repeat protein [Nonomuraea sp. K274]|uniref:SPW repeat protein n=1 Tax=Nonomuraea cypriaca TaxID=1187855 RepID=A0A931A914_9ACTN|nr:SPW repeat protein [Nonomuraea cypriaca]MBF8186879.1 SPW repeat protein [Nonomuraea cypriaca]
MPPAYPSRPGADYLLRDDCLAGGAAEEPTAKAVAGLTFLTGLYLAMSPWVVGFNGFTTLAVTDLIAGIALATLALGFAFAYGRTHGIVWITPLIGVWTIIAPWVVSGDVATTSTIWSNVVTGAVALLLGLTGIFGVYQSRVLR